jgi:hypothetical protein
MTIQGRSKRLYTSSAPPVGLTKGSITRGAIPKDVKVSKLHETAVKDKRLRKKRLVPIHPNYYKLRCPKRNTGFLSDLLESSADLLYSMFTLIRTTYRL